MCTTTINFRESGILLTMNRDEHNSRAPEIPPMLRRCERSGVSWLAPLDGRSGGSWIGCNSHGFLACLLNGEDPPLTPLHGANRFFSRGMIVPAALEHPAMNEALDWALWNLRPLDYRPFILLLMMGNTGMQVTSKGGGKLEMEPLDGPWICVTSSTWQPQRVLPYRHNLFKAWLADGAPFLGELPAFHLSCPEEAAAMSPLVQRFDICTRSITQIELRAGASVEMRYWPNPTRESVDPKIRLRLALDKSPGTPPAAQVQLENPTD
jgi:hypothetical protein